MHEFGLAMRIVEMVEEHARAQGHRRVTQIELELGELSGVMFESLDFSLQTVLKGSSCPRAELVIRRIPGRGQCAGCHRDFPLNAPVGTCPLCGSPRTEVVQGREFKIKSIRVV